MAISFTGTAITDILSVVSDDIALAIENSAFSRVKVNVLRLVTQTENLELVTGNNAYMPIFRTFKTTGVASGGIVLDKGKFDTTENSDAGVMIRSKVFGSNADIAVTGTPARAWAHYTPRRCTGVEQQLGEDSSMLPLLVDTSPYWVLYPGQVLYVTMTQGTATGTLTTGGYFFMQAVWSEDDSFDAGYTVSGKVELNAVPLVGAKVFVLTDLTTAMTDPKVSVHTTAAGGVWSKTLASGVKAAAFVQHDDAGVKYTDEGKPYLEKP